VSEPLVYIFPFICMNDRMASIQLPIDEILPRLKQALAGHQAAVLQAPPGAGKTTRVPLALLEEKWLDGRAILMLEPRRLAATNAARFMAAQRGEEVGAAVGYAIRFEQRTSQATRIHVVTEGVLIRRLQQDPELSGVGLVIFDEFHERSLDSDLALALCRDAQLGLREDLKILIMSATLDAEPVARLLGDAPLVTSSGRRYPVDVRHLEHDPQGPLEAATAAAVQKALGESSGDVLVFLPGAAEIRRCQQRLRGQTGSEVDIRPLYGWLPFAAQEQAILPGARRRVVLATNIAETSLTIEGITIVVDAGFERRPRYDPATGLSRLETVRISAASAEQRAGRAGRLAPGVCYRLWSPATQGGLLPFTPAEIRQADLSDLALDLARWGVREAADLTWLDLPPSGALAGARQLLRKLKAIDHQDRITPYGEQMARIPAHPRLAHLMLLARQRGEAALGCDLAALLSERDILRNQAQKTYTSPSDLLDRLEVLNRFRSGGGSAGDPGGLPAVERAARQWRRILGSGVPGAQADATAEQVGRLLAAAFPDRVGREREPGSGRYLLVNGRGARLSRFSAVRNASWLVAVEVEGSVQSEGDIRLASAIDEEIVRELFAGELNWRRRVFWDEREGRVVARDEQALGALIFAARPIRVPQEEIAAALIDGILQHGLEVLNWTPGARQMLARARLLAEALPEWGWPELSEEALTENLTAWLGPFLGACRNLADLGRLDLLPALQALLGWERLQQIEREAPTHLEVPSGSRIRLDYEAPEPPVLAVKLQELFGLAETPRVACGRVPVLIHLLSPARRPVAVTRDLGSFWSNTYLEVRKELAGRYPKHPWPQDPWSGDATRRTKKKS